MSSYQLELAGRTLPLPSAHSEQIMLDRLTSRLNTGAQLTFTARGMDVIGSVSLYSSVKLWLEDELIFAGRVLGEQVFNSSRGKGKRIEAGGPMDLARSIIATDDANVPRLQYENTTVADVLGDLLGRHGAALQDAGSANGAGFYDQSQLVELTEPVDQYWLENRDLASAIVELLEFGPYALAIDLDNLFWSVMRLDQLGEFALDLSSSSDWGLVSYQIDRRFENVYSAVSLVSDRQVQIAYVQATAAWDSGLETNWQLLHSFYSTPGADDPDDRAWVYRRFSYAGISDLLENHPVELVQKVKDTAGDWTYVPIDTLALDRAGKYVVARYPVLSAAGEGQINIRNALIGGKSQAGEVYIRYRRYTGGPRLSQRYPGQDYAGWALDSGGLARELVVYSPDDRLINEDRARRLWREVNRADQKIRLALTGPMPSTLFATPQRVRLLGADDIELLEAESLYPDWLEYDFGANRLTMELRYIR